MAAAAGRAGAGAGAQATWHAHVSPHPLPPGVYSTNPEQQAEAAAYLEAKKATVKAPIFTECELLRDYYSAEVGG